jgi:hypothetical protein
MATLTSRPIGGAGAGGAPEVLGDERTEGRVVP